LTKLLLPCEPIYRCRKMIAVNSVYDLERLISNCSGSDSEISPLYEEETTLIRREACFNEANMVFIGKKTERNVKMFVMKKNEVVSTALKVVAATESPGSYRKVQF